MSRQLSQKVRSDSSDLEGLALTDERYYGLMEEFSRVFIACGPEADKIFKFTRDVAYGRHATPNDPSEPTPSELGYLMIEDLFASNFEYSPLERSMDIRLLILHPGHQSEPLKCKIQHVAVRDTPISGFSFSKAYEAISYVWGSESKTCSILVNGYRVALTESLFNALVHLRHPHHDRTLWADALCINQLDSKEKARQVALMPEIYTYASKVLVHLGEQENYSECMPEIMEKIGHISLECLRDKRLQTEILGSLGLPSSDSHLWGALVQFFLRPWFSRMWTIQEVVLARDVWVYCGGWEMKWQLIAEVGERFESILAATSQNFWSADFQRARHCAAGAPMLYGFHLARSRTAQRFRILEQQIKSISLSLEFKIESEELPIGLVAKRDFVIEACAKNPNLLQHLEQMFLGFDSIIPSRVPILKLLGLFLYRGATVLQDRLYSLIGLSGDISLLEFPPDYDESPQSTNIRFAMKMVEKGQGMDILFHGTKLSIEPPEIMLPSWVPDWTFPRPYRAHWLSLAWAYDQYPGGFNERTNSKDVVRLVEGNIPILKVSGSRLDGYRDSASIVGLGLASSKFTEKTHKFFQQVDHLFSGASYFTGETWDEVQCRTLVADGFRREKTSKSDLVEQYLEVKGLLGSLEDRKSSWKNNKWAGRWLELLQFHKICKTSNGYVGLVPDTTSAKDEVFMFLGSDLPFILRPIPGLPSCYRFIGGCYIHGLMNGEAWKHVQKQTDVFLL